MIIQRQSCRYDNHNGKKEHNENEHVNLDNSSSDATTNTGPDEFENLSDLQMSERHFTL